MLNSTKTLKPINLKLKGDIKKGEAPYRWGLIDVSDYRSHFLTLLMRVNFVDNL